MILYLRTYWNLATELRIRGVLRFRMMLGSILCTVCDIEFSIITSAITRVIASEIIRVKYSWKLNSELTPMNRNGI